MSLDARYIPAFYFQEVIFDKTEGFPLDSGWVTFYKDNERTELKDIYQISGSPPNYVYEKLTNPVILSSIGTFQNDEGDDIVPYFLPYDENGKLELYYITFDAKSPDGGINPGARQFTREGQPNIADQGGGGGSESIDNYLINGQFRLFEKDSIKIDTADPFNIALLWKFQKSNTSATDTISFNDFPIDQLEDVEGFPVKYVNLKCTAEGSGETYKRFYYDFPDVNSFETSTIRISFAGESEQGSNVELSIVQNFGTGGSSEVTKSCGSFALPTSFSKLTTQPVKVPSIDGKTIGTSSYFRLIIQAPLNETCDISLTNGQLNINEQIIAYDYKDYLLNVAHTVGALFVPPTSQDDGSTPVFNYEVGKIEWDHNVGIEYITASSTLKKGYIWKQGQTVQKNAKVIPTGDIKYERLFDFYENDIVYHNGNFFGYGEDGFYPEQSYGNISLLTNTESGSITNWTDNDTGFSFDTVQNGEVIGFLAEEDESYAIPTERVKVTNTSNGVVTSISAGTAPITVEVVQAGTASLPEISNIRSDNPELSAGTYFLISAVGTDYYFWFKVDGAGTDPAVAGRTGILIELNSGGGVIRANIAIKHALNGLQTNKVTCNAASTLTGGEYFNIHSSSKSFRPYYTVDGIGDDPDDSTNPIKIELIGSDTNIIVAEKTAKAISSYYFVIQDTRGYFLRMADDGSGRDPDQATRYLPGTPSIGNIAGTIQKDEFKAHNHLMGRYQLAGSAADNSVLIDVPPSQTTEDAGGSETRPINTYVRAAIKY